ncbi:hypothetical protein LEMLEM_LOCUS6871 [Lemmus lemmus]
MLPEGPSPDSLREVIPVIFVLKPESKRQVVRCILSCLCISLHLPSSSLPSFPTICPILVSKLPSRSRMLQSMVRT